MAKLSFEEFMKLSDKEKCIRYKDMNDYDRFRARMTEPIKCGMPIASLILTEEQRNQNKIKKKIIIEKIRETKVINRKIND